MNKALEVFCGFRQGANSHYAWVGMKHVGGVGGTGGGGGVSES